MEQENIYEANQLSDELEQLAHPVEYASRGERFVNLLVDIIFLYFIRFLLFFFWAMNLRLNGRSLDEIRDQLSDPFLEYGTGYSFFFLYYFLSEWLSKGRTLGKLCTKTKAVRFEDDGPIGAREAVLRTLCRLVPVEFFSGFGTPWHDTWTKTTVIKKNTGVQEFIDP